MVIGEVLTYYELFKGLTYNLPINRALKFVLRGPPCIACRVKHAKIELK